MFVKWIAVLALASVTACAGYDPGPISDRLEGREDSTVWFTSSDPYDIADFGQAPERVIEGALTFPPGGTPLRGAVILSHGSGGPSSLHAGYGADLTRRGLAVLRIDHFAPRGVSSTAGGQLSVTAQTMVADVFAAQRLLATHPEIAVGRVGHIGWSKGGITALLASVERFSLRAGRAAPLAFAAGFYPFCGLDLQDETLASPLLILIGGADDWTPAPPCREMVDALAARGEPAAIALYDGVYHGFDSTLPRSRRDTVLTIRDFSDRCRLRTDGAGVTRTLDGAHSVATQAARTAYFRACGSRGATYAGDADAGAAARQRLAAFVNQHLP